MAVTNVTTNPTSDSFVGRTKTTVTVSASSAAGERDVEINGIIKQVFFNVPALTGAAATAEFIIHNEDDNVVFSSGEKAESTNHVLLFDRSICGVSTLRVEQSETQTGTDATHTITLVYL